MADSMRLLKKQYGSNSPVVAEQLNLIGDDLSSRGDTRAALKLHQEALTILEWNKCNAELYDFVEKGKEYAVAMALTLRKIGNLMRETNNFLGAAEVFKECLDVFLEGLIEGGGGLKRRLLECEHKRDSKSYQAVLEQVDRKAIGRILCLYEEFRTAVGDITQLFREMQCVKFVGQNAASSRRRRRMTQHAAMEDNLKHALESLSMSSTNTPDPNPGHKKEKSRRRKDFTRSTSYSPMRPKPLSRRAVTSGEENYDHYKALSSMIMPAEESLVIALKRFPLPRSVVGDNKYLNKQSSSLDSLHTEMDSEERSGPPHHLSTSEELSPRCVTRTFFQDDAMPVLLDDDPFKVTSL